MKVKYSLIELPTDIQFILYLISEELKSRRFFSTLQELGLDNSYFQPHLDSLILRSLDMDEDSDETFDAYYKIIERRSRKIKADSTSVTRQALKAYHELLEVRKKLSIKGV
ncbi:hypothetical protein [Chryseosolibacter indicus]|uniref:Uncharacterized protein n=1 Tax=Chryseosolibacter indicus TaxID=2782351 RepID=A0ABS5VZJ3_9BACT|nr:hypothetical protein [Chryseosolibacter indicus]MBT1706334.1 hypothetical protein [Chryseosolibacter indicus]